MDSATRSTSRPGKKAYLLVTLFLFLLVILPFLFWRGTWFGRPLSSRDIGEYLNDAAKPRHAQHALVQIGERIARKDPEVRQWYPKVVELSASPVVELRRTAAWIMGQDHTYEPFHPALLRLLRDPEALVRRNAALALSNFRDPAARPELVAMLRPYTVPSDASGTLHYRLKLGEFVNPGTLVARVGDTEVRSPLPGEVRSLDQKEGGLVQVGAPLLDISADKEHVWEALRALWLVGQVEDLDEVKRYMRGVAGMPSQVQEQAVLTARAIETRGK